jgi:hypothetical protein
MEMPSYNEQMVALSSEYQAATGSVQFTLEEVGDWAIQNGRWQASHASLLRQFTADAAKAMREEYIRDPQGRRVRAKHAVKRDGEPPLWADLYTAPRDHMEAAFSQRRDQIVADCLQLKRDVDSYNDNQNTGEHLQLMLDFTVDVLESELANA